MATSEISKNATPRLYVGNLQFTVDEFALIKIFSRFGKIAKLDFLFHKSGPMRGKPRGYAFVEFATKEDAMKALTGLHDKPLRGRNLVVTFASQMQNGDGSSFSSNGGKYGSNSGSGSHDRRTTLSMVKNQRAPQGADAQIAALEAKLAQMKKSSAASSSDTTSASNSTLPVAPEGLPSKPPQPSRGI
ncbi:rna-binding domain-containing protein [Phaffia rhodozyma]|uniref:Probable RNA-binding protein 18 n=1 Tax=Phaffia rhodozyma TaxID=264483 RepID=A0A0F7SE44_PHARH|nr:rna-binding domain-containing protein [Phaffia rhodozyma]